MSNRFQLPTADELARRGLNADGTKKAPAKPAPKTAAAKKTSAKKEG